jgi:hypothetical protein
MLKLLLGLILTMSILTLAKGKNQSSTTLEPIICQQPCTSNGVCDSNSGECNCNPGWMGDRCHLRGGKVKLNSSEGWLADAVGNYTVDQIYFCYM